jgi:hypothetical protein
VIPTRSWGKGVFEETINFLALDSASGRLEVDFSPEGTLKGTFKTSNPGTIFLNGGELPQSLQTNVCVKQVYFTHPGTIGIRRHEEDEEASLISAEALCLDWATVLLDLTYGFIKDFESAHGHFPGDIPHLRFVNAAIAESQKGPKKKYFLIEEWINTSKAPFTKYINNGLPVSCVPEDAPAEVQNLASFLCFAQHVQFHLSGGSVYTSDYQGMPTDIVFVFDGSLALGSGPLLTDPQIITNPYVPFID